MYLCVFVCDLNGNFHCLFSLTQLPFNILSLSHTHTCTHAHTHTHTHTHTPQENEKLCSQLSETKSSLRSAREQLSTETQKLRTELANTK